MKTNALGFALLIAVITSGSNRTNAQQVKPSPEVPKFEFGMEFTSLTINSRDTVVGSGGRITYNWNRHIAIEAAGYFSAGKTSGELTGSITEGLFGIKAGQRFKRFGIFGKARPGFINYSRADFEFIPTGSGGSFPFVGVFRHRTDFAADLGGVLEIYPSKRVVLRFDAGSTFDHAGRKTVQSITFDPVTGSYIPASVPSPGFTRHHFQFIGGVAFRF